MISDRRHAAISIGTAESFSGLQLIDAISDELSCMNEMSQFMGSIPDELCYLSNYPIAEINKTQCWTGTFIGR